MLLTNTNRLNRWIPVRPLLTREDHLPGLWQWHVHGGGVEGEPGRARVLDLRAVVAGASIQV